MSPNWFVVATSIVDRSIRVGVSSSATKRARSSTVAPMPLAAGGAMIVPVMPRGPVTDSVTYCSHAIPERAERWVASRPNPLFE